MHIKLVFATYKVRVKKGKRQARSKMMFDQKKKIPCFSEDAA